MKTIIFSVALLGCCLSARGQLVLNAGDSYTYQFDMLPLVGTGTAVGFPGEVRVFATIASGTFGVGDSIGLSIFENDPSEPAIGLNILTDSLPPGGQFGQGIGAGAGSGWSDLQGAISLTQFSGSATIESITLERFQLTGPTTINVYRDVIVPVPEPAGWSLLALGGVMIAFRRKSRG